MREPDRPDTAERPPARAASSAPPLVLVARVSEDGRVRSLNASALRALGYDCEALPDSGVPFRRFVHPDRVRDVTDALASRQSERVLHACPILAADGTWRTVHVTLHSDASPDGCVLVVARDTEDAAATGDADGHLLAGIRDALLTLNHEWRVTYANEAAHALLRAPNGDLTGMSVWDVLPEARGSEVEAALRDAVRTQQPAMLEIHAALPELWAETRLYPTRHGLTVTLHDIRPRKADERLEQDRSRVLEMTLRGAPLREILLEITRLVERQSEGHVCSVLLLRGDRLYTAAAEHLPEAFTQAIDGLRVGHGNGVCGTSAFTKAPVVVEDTLTDPLTRDFRSLAALHGLRSCASTPILNGDGEVLGTFAMYSREPGALTERQVRVMDRARHLAAVAVEHDRLTDRLRFQARHDALTGLANRSLAMTLLECALTDTQARSEPVSVLFIDLDDFHGVNDLLGHAGGDDVLVMIAERLRSCCRRGDSLARVGGDEFMMVLPYAAEQEAVLVARRVLTVLAEPFTHGSRELRLGVSVGVATGPYAGADPETLRRHADVAMHHAKTRRAGYAVFEKHLNRSTVERLQLATDLRRAVEQNALDLHYQPQVDFRTGRATGVEALLRWRHPHLGYVPPAQFIPIAEETGLIVTLGTWVLREACQQGVRWAAHGTNDLRVAVNVSALQFDRDDFVDVVASILRDTAFPPERLELELTESIVMRDVHASVARMAALRDLGVTIAIDDFGTGYSSLNYLQRLPLNILKIDRSFVRQLTHAQPTQAVVRAIATLARHLGLHVVAEGIETPEQYDILRELDCDAGQGFLFARPMPAQDVPNAIRGTPAPPGT